MSRKNHVFFIVDRLELMKVIKQLEKRTNGSECQCELTLINDRVSFYVPGATLDVKVRNKGSAKASFEFKMFCQILRTYKIKELKIEIVDNRLIIETFSFDSATTFFKNDKVLRSIILPKNFTELDLISIWAGDRYTVHEMRFNNVLELVNEAAARLEKNLATAARALKNYGITREEIEQLIDKKIKQLLDSNAEQLKLQEQVQDQDKGSSPS